MYLITTKDCQLFSSFPFKPFTYGKFPIVLIHKYFNNWYLNSLGLTATLANNVHKCLRSYKAYFKLFWTESIIPFQYKYVYSVWLWLAYFINCQIYNGWWCYMWFQIHTIFTKDFSYFKSKFNYCWYSVKR